jgi:SAM-dependent methyltransferase
MDNDHLHRWSRTALMAGNAESIPLPDESQDAVTSIFMFHELPPSVRRIVLSEFARVLKPGGRLVDSLQHGDEPDYDGLLELFPQSFHEPYYLSYIKEDFAALCQDRGLTYIRNARAFVSKVIVFDKPAGFVTLAGFTCFYGLPGDSPAKRFQCLSPPRHDRKRPLLAQCDNALWKYLSDLFVRRRLGSRFGSLFLRTVGSKRLLGPAMKVHNPHGLAKPRGLHFRRKRII